MYHLQFKSLNREKGRSLLQYAAYISGGVLKDNRTNTTYNHLSKEEVVNSRIYLPECAPDEMKKELANAIKDPNKMNSLREKLWNSLEEREKGNICVLGKCLDIAYPYEFDDKDRKECRDKVIKIFLDKGYAVDIADHLKDGNPHMQALISARAMDSKKTWADIKEIKGYLCANKYGEKKVFRSIKELKEYNNRTNLNFMKYSRIPVIDKKTGKQKISAKKNERMWQRKTISSNPITTKDFLLDLRQSWEDVANEILPEGSKISCKSYKEQGINKIPQIYEGFWARKFKNSDRVLQNQKIKEINEQLDAIRLQYNDLDDEYNDLVIDYFNEDDEIIILDRLLHFDDTSWFDDLKNEISEMENYGNGFDIFWANNIKKNEQWLEDTLYDSEGNNYFQYHRFNNPGAISAVSGLCTYLRSNHYKEFESYNHQRISIHGLNKRQKEIEEEIEKFLQDTSKTYSY